MIMKVKILQSNDLFRIERELHIFLNEVKVENIQIVVNNGIYVIMVTYYELI